MPDYEVGLQALSYHGLVILALLQIPSSETLDPYPQYLLQMPYSM